MRLIGLYEFENLKNVEENHRQFCQKNELGYEKIYLRIEEKLRYVYSILDENPDDEFLFIDSYSFFKSEKVNFKFTTDIYINGVGDKLFDNFFYVKSTSESKRIILEALTCTVKNIVDKVPIAIPEILKKCSTNQYPTLIDGLYFNINILYHDNYHLVKNIICCQYKMDKYNPPISNILCLGETENLPDKSNSFDVINPGQSKAFVSLYTTENKEYGKVSEENISEWCKDNQTTLYIYRKLPEDLKNITGNWAKPDLILRHIKQHDWISWIDSDILIVGKVSIPYEGEIMVYSDPGYWYFNSGFMSFKNTEKNIELLNIIISKMESLDKSSVYSSGGDQAVFNTEIRKVYGELIPKNNLTINSSLNYHFFKKPEEINAMIHFMGIHVEVRRRLMYYYNEISKLYK